MASGASTLPKARAGAYACLVLDCEAGLPGGLSTCVLGQGLLCSRIFMSLPFQPGDPFNPDLPCPVIRPLGTPGGFGGTCMGMHQREGKIKPVLCGRQYQRGLPISLPKPTGDTLKLVQWALAGSTSYRSASPNCAETARPTGPVGMSRSKSHDRPHHHCLMRPICESQL